MTKYRASLMKVLGAYLLLVDLFMSYEDMFARPRMCCSSDKSS